MAESGRLRIGELSRRVGVSPELLRAWETRYGLVDPDRTPGGLRLYSKEDERRVLVMRRQIAAGLSAAEAARVALEVPAVPVSPDAIVRGLDEALTALDEPAAQILLDRAFGSLALETSLGEVVIPFLHELGVRWATTDRTIAQEHFASNVIGGRLRALSRGWGDGSGSLALLACPSGEEHDLGMLCFGLLLHERGWRIVYLGAQTPTAELAGVVAEIAPDVVVLGAIGAQRFLDAADAIRSLAARTRVAIGGAGATAALAALLGVEFLPGDLVAAARVLGTAGQADVAGD